MLRAPASRSKTFHAFTLIELLVVVAIIGVLSAVILPVFGSVQKTADKTQCTSNLRQIVVASNLAATDNNGNYPNMHGYAWEQGNAWIADALAPYVAEPSTRTRPKLFRCPAAGKNQQEAWLLGSQYCQYRFNIWYGQSKKPLVGYASAVLFFDTTYTDWTPAQYAHFPGGGASMNVAYADGHVAAVSYADFKKLNASSNESQNDFFQLGWVK